MEDLAGLKSALIKTKERAEKYRQRIAELEADNQRLKDAFDALVGAIALRNPPPPQP